MLPPVAERARLAKVLERLESAVEELLLGGLTTATDSTSTTVSMALQEAARFKLLRLGSSLRGTVDELGRYNRQDPAFSRRRLAFFLNRSWLLARGLSYALNGGNEALYDRLAWSPATISLTAVRLACLGVVKKVAAGSFVAFEFRLRAIGEGEVVPGGRRFTWSAVFPIKPGVDIPPEGFLHLIQKPKFTPAQLLDRKEIEVKAASVAVDEAGVGRILLNDASTLAIGPAFSGWSSLLGWDPAAALERLSRHRAGPLDLDNELQEEVVLEDYRVGAPLEGDEAGQSFYPLSTPRLDFRAVVGPGLEGKGLRANLETLRKKKAERPPLFGLLHYERCQLVLQPLATFGADGPNYLTMEKVAVDKAALLRTISFR